ncbi:NADPH:adrenodoxin oxidoreductase, mitochondrial isoform X2 [Cannabis sativa]|uniref:NADPH:adrenodoxin oxidoreductase, mitochondrial isoform X2 n=1 Tax=Cannabis sativa TaxID=3483 RepID=UPI0029CA8FCC|nr:NADPH:adrenodoxin oxidoreductase, mitochondrial isoform X2 [Cannabis sativa]
MVIYRASSWLSRAFSTVSSHPLRVCIVGSGPAGFYTAEKMLKAHQEAQVDIVDRLPTPFGLVRSGVAPDHPETKDLAGIYSAREFVWWYNGHPDCVGLNPDLKSTDTAVILGQGNVALDVARILLRPTAELATTDIASHALAALKESNIRKVYLVGRRGPVQAACTTKELRELLGIRDLYVHIQKEDLHKTPVDEEELKNNRIQRRIYELLSKAVTTGPSHPSPGQRELHFVFFRKPDRFLQSHERISHVAGVRLEKTSLHGVEPGKQIAVGTKQFEDLGCGMALKSIGYKSKPVDGLPFDNQQGIVPNIKGRVLSDTSTDSQLVEEGLYVCGWLKRGPSGIIGTNLYCAEETVASISEDVEQGLLKSTSRSPKPGREGLLQLLDDRNVRVLPFTAWEKIDSEERRRGSINNKPREKLATWEELLKVAGE